MNFTPKTEDFRKILEQTLQDLGIELAPGQLHQLLTHFSLLLRWNDKMNLTSIREPQEIAFRHFGESLLLSKLISPSRDDDKSVMIDVGTGAGFPGLPLAIIWPWVRLIMLEPNHKKVAFLKEVIRGTEVNAEVKAIRLEESPLHGLSRIASLVTMRAVSVTRGTLVDLATVLKPDGMLALFVGSNNSEELMKSECFTWNKPVQLPFSDQRMILIGKPRVNS